MTINRFYFTQQVARVYDETNNMVGEARADDLCNLLYGGRARDVGLLPPAVRWLATDGTSVIFERPPASTLLDYDGDVVEVFLPWTVWVIRFDSPQMHTVNEVRLFSRNYAMASEMDRLGVMPLPGIDLDGSIKLPAADLALITKTPSTLGEMLPRIVDTVISQKFTKADWKLADHVPQGWPTEGDTVLGHLATASHLEITATEFPAAAIPTVADLIEVLEPDESPGDDVLEFLGAMVAKAAR